MLRSRISQWMALASSTGYSTACRLRTGSAPGRPRHVGQMCVLGSPPYLLTQPQKALVAVINWTWTSRPMTGWYLARMSGESSISVAAMIAPILPITYREVVRAFSRYRITLRLPHGHYGVGNSGFRFPAGKRCRGAGSCSCDVQDHRHRFAGCSDCVSGEPYRAV